MEALFGGAAILYITDHKSLKHYLEQRVATLAQQGFEIYEL